MKFPETDPDRLLDLGQNHLPPDEAEAVLRIAVGEKPEPSPAARGTDRCAWRGRRERASAS